MKTCSILRALFTLSFAACGVQQAPRGLPGAYRLDDGRILSVRPSEGASLRYREYQSGMSGRLYPVQGSTYQGGNGFHDREPVAVTAEFKLNNTGVAETVLWTARGADPIPGSRIGREHRVRFESDGTWLTGRIHLPDGEGPFPGIVLVQGSGDDPGSEWLFNGDFLVAHGFAVLAYDKRGTGGSEGDFTFDFQQLARDAAAGVAFLRSEVEVDGRRIGLSGYSQGGWVAPLAASMADARFVLVSYGMIESPAEEARMEMLDLLDKGGATAEDLAEADSLVTAAVSVVANRFRSGWERFDLLKRRHRNAAWLRHLKGTPVDQLMRYPRWFARLIGPRYLPQGLDWDYDSTDLLNTLCVPVSWFLAGKDISAPNKQTIPKLLAMESGGLPVELTLFPEADHVMLEFIETDGAREYTGYVEGYFPAEVEAARRWSSGTSSRSEYPGCRASAGPERSGV